MKTRRHHNNTGYRQIKRGKTRSQVERIRKRLGIPQLTRKEEPDMSKLITVLRATGASDDQIRTAKRVERTR